MKKNKKNKKKPATNWVYKRVIPDYSTYEQKGDIPLNLELLKECLSQQAESYNTTQQLEVHKFILSKLEGHNCDFWFDGYGNMYVQKGDPGIGVVAHVDDVHDYIDDKRIIQVDNFLVALNGKNGQQHGTAGKL